MYHIQGQSDQEFFGSLFLLDISKISFLSKLIIFGFIKLKYLNSFFKSYDVIISLLTLYKILFSIEFEEKGTIHKIKIAIEIFIFLVK